MEKLYSRSEHAKALLSLGLPLIGGNLAQMFLHVGDIIIVGRYGPVELASVVLGANFFFMLFILGSGFAHAVMPMVAQALARGDETDVRRVARMGMWLSVFFGISSYILFWYGTELLLAMWQAPEIATLAGQFLAIAGLGMIPALLVMVLKSYLAAFGRTQVVLWVTVAGTFINIPLCYALVFGVWGAAEMGVRGAALASLSVQILTVVVLAIYASSISQLRRFKLFQRIWRMDISAMARVFYLGLPIGFSGLSESALFSATTIMMGWIGTMELAAHGVVLQITATGFMIHVGLASAVTVRTGWFAGGKDWDNLRNGAVVALMVSASISLVLIVIYLSVPQMIVGWFIDADKKHSAQIIAYGSMLMVYSAAFQLVDGLQVMMMGLLRGIHDTKVPMWLTGIVYWFIAIPVAYMFAFTFGWGGAGLWAGLVVGLSLAALTLYIRFWRLVPRE